MTPTSAPAKPSRREATALTWAERLQRFDPATTTVTAFCHAEGVSVPAFYAWRRRLAKAAQPPATAAPSEPPPFLPIRLTPAGVANATPLELLLTSGVRLRIPPDADLAFVRALVAALEGPPC